MPLAERETIRARMNEPLAVRVALGDPLPKYQFPAGESPPQEILQLVRDELLLDGNAAQNFATFCQTYSEPAVHELMDVSLSKNLIDKDEYPQSAEIETRCVHMLADLWHAPVAANTIGCSAIGSSEASMLAGMAMKWRWRKKRQARGLPTDRPNLVCGPVQICWHKFARYWDVELREMPLKEGRTALEPAAVRDRVDENTIGVVATLGVTYTGVYEPVEAIAQALDDLQTRTQLDIDLHIDAASGGFLAPFCAPELRWDFRLPRVKSINASGHKFGLAPLGVGWTIWRDAAELPEELIFRVSYLGGDMPCFQINFSRPAGQVITQYYQFVRLGREGYTRVQGACHDLARWFAGELARRGPFQIIHDGDPARGIPAVCWRIAPGAEPGFTLYDLANRLRMRGWQVPAYPLAPELERQIVQRLVVRQGVSRDLLSLLLEDVSRALDHFRDYPVTVSLERHEAGGYSHA